MFSPEKNYQRLKIYCVVARLILWCGFLFIFHAISLFYVTGGVFFPVVLSSFFSYYRYALLFYCCVFLIFLPLDFLENFRLEEDFGLNTQTKKTWFLDYCKRFLLQGLFFSLGFFGLYVFLPLPFGWVYLWILWVFIGIFISYIAPLVLIPIFYPYAPLEKGTLRQELLLLAATASLDLKDIYKIRVSHKTKKANAAVVGLGQSKKLMLADTLLTGFSPQEIQAVCAHEIGHFKKRDEFRCLVFEAAGAFLIFGCSYILFQAVIEKLSFLPYTHVLNFPIFALVFSFCSLFWLPISNAFRRKLEFAADKYAVKLSRNPAAFIAALQKLGRVNFSDAHPSRLVKFFFYTHPPLGERLKHVERVQA